MIKRYFHKFFIDIFHINKVLFCVFLLILCSCSIKKNTMWTRFYHNLTSRYNVLFNGEKAFDESYSNGLDNLKESYFLQIPLDPVSYDITDQNGGNGNYSEAIKKGRKAIEEHSLRAKPAKSDNWKKDPKERQWQQQIEYNSYIYNAWILIGKSQFYSGDMLGALSTFSFMDRLYKSQPDIRMKANIWQVRCYNQLGWYSDGRNLLDEIEKNISNAGKAEKRQYNIALVNNLIGLGKTSDAIKILEKLAPNMGESLLSARAFFLLGQLYEKNDDKLNASKAFGEVLSYATPMDIELSARLKSIQLNNKDIDEKIKSIKKLSDKNRYKDYLDAIMFSLGNDYLMKKDTTQAITAFQLGADTSKTKKTDYALNLIALGNIFFEKGNYVKSADAFSKSINSIDGKYKNYNDIKRKNDALSRLKIFAEPLMLQDSLRHIASLSQKDLIKHIDSLILVAKKNKNDEADNKWMQEQQNKNNNFSRKDDNTISSSKGNGKFYFYNPILIENGKIRFRKKWGNISLQDNWQRNGMQIISDKIVVKSDSIKSDKPGNMPKDYINNSDEDPQSPFSYSYYLAALPLTPEAKKQSDSIVSKSLLEISNLLLTEFDRTDKAEKNYMRIIKELPNSNDREEAIRRLILLFSSQGREKEAETFRLLYLKDYPTGSMSKNLSNTNYINSIKNSKDTIEKKYSYALDMQRKGQPLEVEKVYEEMLRDYPGNQNMDKLTLLSAFAKGQLGDIETMLKRMQKIKDEYASSDIGQMTNYILEEVKKGRQIVNGNYKFDIDRKQIYTKDEKEQTPFIYNKKGVFSILVLYPYNENITSGEVFFRITAFNYEYFTQEDLSINTTTSDLGNMFFVKGVRNPYNYITLALSDKGFLENISPNAIIIPIVEKDLQMLNSHNINDYVNGLKNYINKETFENILYRVEKSNLFNNVSQ